ncbi:MAG: hypothetical protein AAFX53_06500 [Bacteroidota bacterium]
MEKKRLLAQVLAAVLLYTVISLILEKDWSQPVIFKELGEGVIFGLLYGAFVHFREKWRNKGE